MMTCIKRRAIAMAAVMALSGPFLATSNAAAENYDVSEVEYKNNGAYVACFSVNWMSQETGKHLGYREKCIANGSTAHFKLADTIGYEGSTDKPAEGDEVWGYFYIISGKSKGCRKDGTKFFYKAGAGTVKYKSGGTTFNNNRCKIASKP